MDYDWTVFAVAGRVVERLVVVLFAGLTVYLGYRLFLEVPRMRDSEGEVKLLALNMTAKVARIGPGVFFAIFGVAVLLASYLHPVSIESPPRTQAAEAKEGKKFIGISGTEQEQTDILRMQVVAHTIGSLNKLAAAAVTKCGADSAREHGTTIRDAKLLIMDLVWRTSEWGDPATFKQAVTTGRRPNDMSLASSTRDALAFYERLE
jgi:hypothetical protein